MAKPSEKGDPFANLPRSNLSRRFQTIDIPPRSDRLVIDDPRPVERKAETKPSKRGRKAKHADKPWEAEGVSRMTWYRRRKAAEK